MQCSPPIMLSVLKKARYKLNYVTENHDLRPSKLAMLRATVQEYKYVENTNRASRNSPAECMNKSSLILSVNYPSNIRYQANILIIDGTGPT